MVPRHDGQRGRCMGYCRWAAPRCGRPKRRVDHLPCCWLNGAPNPRSFRKFHNDNNLTPTPKQTGPVQNAPGHRCGVDFRVYLQHGRAVACQGEVGLPHRSRPPVIADPKRCAGPAKRSEAIPLSLRAQRSNLKGGEQPKACKCPWPEIAASLHSSQ